MDGETMAGRPAGPAHGYYLKVRAMFPLCSSIIPDHSPISCLLSVSNLSLFSVFNGHHHGMRMFSSQIHFWSESTREKQQCSQGRTPPWKFVNRAWQKIGIRAKMGRFLERLELKSRIELKVIIFTQWVELRRVEWDRVKYRQSECS